MMEIGLPEARELGRVWGAKAPLAPLNLEYDVCETHENIERNIRQTLESEYEPFIPLLDMPHERQISVVGFGPSLAKTYTQLKGEVLACNGAHNWLIDKGVIPKYGMFWDAHQVTAGFVKPHKDVTYLIASRCHRDVFKLLEGYRVYVWHTAGDKILEDLLVEYKRMEPMLSGGSAAVTRAMMVVSCMGYRNINLFGADASFDGTTTHVKESIVTEKPLEIWCNGKMFYSTSWMAGQVEEFKVLGPMMRDQGCNIELYGDGLLPYVAGLNGFTVHNSTVEGTNG